MGGEGEWRRVPQGPLQPGAYSELRRRDGGSGVSLAACGRQMGGRGGRRSGGNAGGVALELPYAFLPASGSDGRLHRHDLRRPRRGNDRRNRAGATGGDPGEASPENRMGERRASEGGARSPASPSPRNLLHRQFGEDAGERGVAPPRIAGRPRPPSRGGSRWGGRAIPRRLATFA